MTGLSNIEEQLRRVLLWREAVLRDPERIVKGLDDPISIACGLFMGPIWDDAIAALSDTARASLKKKIPNAAVSA